MYFSNSALMLFCFLDLSTDAAAAFTSAKTIFEVEDGMEKSLLNLGDWVLEFSVFFLRNIFHYLETEDLPLREDISVIRKTKSLQCFFILNAHLFPSLVPCVPSFPFSLPLYFFILTHNSSLLLS